MPTLKGKTLFITGASRGIGKAIALRAARDGANVVIAAKTTEPHPKLPGTIHSAAKEIEAAGGRALACVVDVRFEDQIARAVEAAFAAFGGIDVLVNNASAISLTGTLETSMKRFDLMQQVNTRGTFACSQACIPHLRNSANPHSLNLSPPPVMRPEWFAAHPAYTIAKFGMSMCVLGMAAEFRDLPIAVNALWPRTMIATSAVQNLLGGEASMRGSRTPEIVADAAHVILTRPEARRTPDSSSSTKVSCGPPGITDFARYQTAPEADLIPGLRLFEACRSRAWTTGERPALRREILDDVGDMLHDELAADAWGRVLVEVVRAEDGTPLAAGVDVEEVFGDEARVDAAFGGPRARAVMPVLAKAAEALCAMDDVELEDVRGGTFVRIDEARFAWLPGLVHAPSRRLDGERDGLLRALRAKNDALAERFGFPARGKLDIDHAREIIRFAPAGAPPMTARGTLVGTFAPASRTWGWGGTNPHVPDAVSRASAAVVDSILDRDMWELSTPVFATDELTSWALAAFVCDRAAGDGVYCAPESDGLVFVLLRDVDPLNSP